MIPVAFLPTVRLRSTFFRWLFLDFRDLECGNNDSREPFGTDILLLPANEVWAKVIFLHLSDILLTVGEYLGRYTPGQDTPGHVHPPGRYTSPRAGTPSPSDGQNIERLDIRQKQDLMKVAFAA